MSAIRVLLAGESWVSNSTHFKGWDFFSSTVYETGIGYLQQAMDKAGVAFTHMPGHLAATEFPLDINGLDQYDVVILDTPPVLAVTDAAVAVRVAATSLLVARFGKTSLKEMENCIKRLQQMGACIKGTVLNDVVKSAALYYHSGYGQYEYGHSTTRQPRKD